jgi:hypothetical protein
MLEESLCSYCSKNVVEFCCVYCVVIVLWIYIFDWPEEDECLLGLELIFHDYICAMWCLKGKLLFDDGVFDMMRVE